MTFSSLFSLARASARGDIAPLIERASLFKTSEAARDNSFYFKMVSPKLDLSEAFYNRRERTPSTLHRAFELF